MNLKGKKVLVLGMRSSGISACSLLKREQAEVCYFDDFINPLEGEYFNVKDSSQEEIFASLSLIVVSPAIPQNHLLLIEARKRKVPIVSELEFGSSFIKVPKIAITGTNGKTTTVCMLDKIISNAGFKTKAMGNIGYPVSQVVLDNEVLDFALIEASSFQLDNIKYFRPKLAVVMNLAPDHMERYDNFASYITSKKNILRNQKKEDFAILNFDDKNVRAFSEDCKANVVWISTKKQMSPVYIKDNYYFLEDTVLCHIKESKAKGEHNRYNLLAAMNVGAIVGCRREHMLNLIKDYVPLPHRVEYVSTINGKNFYNDSKGTNIQACKVAIDSLDGEIGLIMGGSDKNEDYCEFFDNVDEKIKYITVTGNNSEKIYGAALKMGFTDIVVEDNLKSCIDILVKNNDIKNILFSPSAASFDRYTSYAERGDIFKRLVYEINI